MLRKSEKLLSPAGARARRRDTRARQRAVGVRRAQRDGAGLDAGPLVQLVQHGAVERQVDDDPADGASARPAGLTARITSSGSPGASGRRHGDRAGESLGLLRSRAGERGRLREPAQVLPRARARRPAGPDGDAGMNTIDKRRVAERAPRHPAHAVDGLFRRPRRAPDLGRRGLGQELHLSRHDPS